MKSKTYLFSAKLAYTFSKSKLATCEHCGKAHDEHADKSCLFEATEFKQREIMSFFELLMRNGGILTLKTGPFTLTQQITATAVDQNAHFTQGEILTVGDASLVEK